MNINRRKFIKISSITTANLVLLSGAGNAALLNTVLDEGSMSLTGNELLKNFVSPPDDCKSSCYWWWFNGLVDKEGITRDLEEFREKGMGGVLLVNSAGGLGGVPFPQGEKFLSEEWKACYRHAMKEAKRLNIEVGINLNSGWCMGGPWIKPENSGRWYLQSELILKGPQKFFGKLPLPGNRNGYDNVFNPPGYKTYIDLPLEELDYHDTAVVAIFNPDEKNSRILGVRANVLAAKTNHKDASNISRATDIMGPVLFPWKNDPEDKPVLLSKVIDLTAILSEDGHLEWDVPPGNWTIIRTGHRMTGSRLMIAQPEADGLSVDWFDRKGVEIQFDNLGKMFLEEAAREGAKPTYFCDDSFEDGFPNWTTKILEKFTAYRRYDAKPYLAVLAGYIIVSAEVSDRFLNDYRKTLADCMADEHYQPFAELCHENGILVQNEAAGPSRSGTMCMDGLKNLGKSDLPMGEFWLGNQHEDQSTLSPNQPYGVSRLDSGQNKVTKMAASASHIYGRKTASAEAFTSFRHWTDYPGSLKQALDRAYCEGINRIVIHTSTATRPKDGKPGYEYGAGTHFNPNVTWWEKSAPFLSYVTRCQYLLQAGRFVADVLYYNGDGAPNLVEQKHIDPALGEGYDYDVCNEEVLLTRLSVKNSRMVLPDGMSYAVLVLPDNDRMPLPVVLKIKELIKSGATVIGPRPQTDSGLHNYPQCDLDIKSIAVEVWGNTDGNNVRMHNYGWGRIFDGESIRKVLLNDGIKPDFEYIGNDVWIDYIHRSTSEAEVYFLTNRKDHTAKIEGLFRVHDRKPEIWDPIHGTVLNNPAFKIVEKRIAIPLEFAAFQSVFIVFPKTPGKTAKTGREWLWQNSSSLIALNEIQGPWQVNFDPEWGGPSSALFSSLQDWSTYPDDRIKYYSGKATYIKKINIESNPQPGKALFLDLGVVKNIAEVWLNGKSLGIVWTAPWRVEITDFIKLGDNQLEIEVINLWPNRIIGDAGLPADQRLTNTNIQFKKDDPLLSSGLLGPVTILAIK